MAGTREPSSKQVAQDATNWLILLQDAPDDADLRARFDDWYAQSPAHQSAWDSTQKTARLMGQVTAQQMISSRNGTADDPADWQRFLHDTRAHDVLTGQDSHPVRAASSAHRSDTESTVAGAEIQDAPVENTVPGNAAMVVQAQGRFARRGNGSWRGIGLGGLAVAASLFAALFGPKIATQLQADYSTGTGQINTITLADNSRVTLAPESALRVTFEDGVRAVELLGGEAFFEVTPDPLRPFKVAARLADVTVLGTGFDVSEGAGVTRVSVEHGRVRVDNAAHLVAHSEFLEPGQSLQVRGDGNVLRGDTPTGQVAAWRNHQLIAQDQPLGDVVDRLRGYFKGAIIISDEALSGQAVTGVYRLTDPVLALRAIARAQNAVVREVTPWVLVVSPS